MTHTMQAVALTRRGNIDALEPIRLPISEPQAGEVLVRIRAVALNHLDVWVRKGVASPKLPLPHLLGSDIAGEVAAMGPGVEGLSEGTKVMLNPGVSCGHCERCLSGHDNLCRHYQILGEHRWGGYAQYISIPRTNVLPMPEGLDFVEAASVPLSALTAYQMVFDRAQLKPWETVLILAAASGVSVNLIQLCKLVGAKVIAVASTPEKQALALKLGADHVIGSHEDQAQAVKALTAGEGADVVFDHTGADNWQRSLKSLKWGGRLVTCGATSGHEAVTPLNWVFFKQLSILGSTMGSKADLHKIQKFVQEGKLRPVVGHVLDFAQAREAHGLLESRQALGKVVLRVP
ncbi:zinc-binding dehydrogenase [Deinococcus cellulosilyticus]|uniref:Alcohol dehydrogenase n=1 Tax=Deinococcus cellulosilyticus (strain DSM 18568 / NBRC 106333 / KACC 11606 / 5516J-15) TaxID=1223518 RepID=A0A511N7L7_DEIC1|nr:zinc-binding dehydrogenase [Deinococcus cellulosilyticus]GEM48835.1 alcohol dehydrogenase [Deinococcus cellulosilyticus NBRC 106333 = KACC 11606]